jgi:hypothetical protein
MTQINPFTPEVPALADVFAGRTNELTTLCESLERAASGKSVNFCIFGERGIGKTSVLNCLESYALGKRKWKDSLFNFIVARATIHPKMGALELLEMLENQIRTTRDPCLGKFAAMWEKFIKSISSASVFGVGVTRLNAKDVGYEESRRRLAKLIKAIGSNAPSDNMSFRGVVIILDEADSASKDLDLGRLLKSLADDIGGESPILIAVCGLPFLVDNLRESHASSLRLFTYMELGKMERDEIGGLLDLYMQTQTTEPKVKMTLNARDLLVNLSEGYPHFAQVFGFYAFAMASDLTIDEDIVADGVDKRNGPIEHIGDCYEYKRLYENLSDAELQVIENMKANKTSEIWFSQSDLKDGFAIPDVFNKAIESLVSLGVVLSNNENPKKYRFRHTAFLYWIHRHRRRSEPNYPRVASLFGVARKIANKNFAGLRQELERFGVDSARLSELKEAINKDGRAQGLGPFVARWISDLQETALKGDIELAREQVYVEIPTRILEYLNSRN